MAKREHAGELAACTADHERTTRMRSDTIHNSVRDYLKSRPQPGAGGTGPAVVECEVLERPDLPARHRKPAPAPRGDSKAAEPIIVVVDDSEQGEAALDVAAHLARHLAARLALVHV